MRVDPRQRDFVMVRRLKGDLRGLVTGEALSVPYYRNAELAAWVKQVVAREGIHEAVAFSGPMAQYLDVPGLTRRVIDFMHAHLAYDIGLADLAARPAGQHVVVTGRGAPPELVEAAHTVSEIKVVKHAFKQGIRAQPGIEF